MVAKPDRPKDEDAERPARGDAAPRGERPARTVRTADEMAEKQRDISVSEFFSKNRHLLGFDNPMKALMTTVKEGVDNALDACEEAGILPEVVVEITRVADMAADAPIGGSAAPGLDGASAAARTADASRSAVPDASAAAAETTAVATAEAAPGAAAGANRLFQRSLFDADADPSADEPDDPKAARRAIPKKGGRKVTDPPEKFVIAIEDNGPGIVQEQIGKVFGKLLYGSKFHRLRQSLTGDQPVLVERGGRVSWISIGELVDGLVPGGAEVSDVSRCGIRTPAFDPETGRYAWRTVSHAIRHARANEVLEVVTECGKSVRVTGCHSLFTWDAQTRRVREVEARTLRAGDHVVAPRRLPAPARRRSVNLVEELAGADLSSRQIFVYGVDAALLTRLRSTATTSHRVGPDGRSRIRLSIRGAARGPAVEVLDDSWRQYEARGFLPLQLAIELGLSEECADGRLRTYFHGRAVETPVTWELTAALLRFLGLYVAEGHADRRQAAFTFSDAETDHVEEVTATARSLGLGTSVEKRPRHATRVKLFGGAIDLLLPAWCGAGAHAKRVPHFVFGASSALRQHFLDGLYLGDGHRVVGRDVLMLGTVSETLVRDVETLWLEQGVVASRNGPFVQRGLGRSPSIAWRLDVHGGDIDRSHVLASESERCHENRYRGFPASALGLSDSGASARTGRVPIRRGALIQALGIGTGPAGAEAAVAVASAAAPGAALSVEDLSRIAGRRVTRHLPESFVRHGLMEPVGDRYAATPALEEPRRGIESVVSFGDSDLSLLRVREVRAVEDPGEFVYDLSVPGCENFVAGHGGLACHNSRGQQGIGISAAGMYGQITTGKPVRITSRTSKKKPAHYMEVALDLQKNHPDVRRSEDLADWHRQQGTRVEIELEAKYQKGQKSVDTYLRATALANPHVTLRYKDPEGSWQVWERATRHLPAEPREVQPHPYGVELGMLLQMLKTTENRKLGAFLVNEFSRVTRKSALEICELAGLNAETWVARVAREEASALHAALGRVKLMNPPTDCVSPIGEGLLVDSLQREYPKAFLVAKTRAPAVYRGNPFQIEVALAHDPSAMPADQPITLLRFANRVPLLYQQGACAISKAVTSVRWKNYDVQHPRGALPVGPIVLAVHVASVWVPFTSESKEAVASYEEIIEEIRLGVMECARSLGQHISKVKRTADEIKKRDYIARYIPKISEGLQRILEFDNKERDATTVQLTEILNRSRNL